MPLFRCDKCDAVENTACGCYWGRERLQGGRALCSECGKGEWHGRFPKEIAGDNWEPEKPGSDFIKPTKTHRAFLEAVRKAGER